MEDGPHGAERLSNRLELVLSLCPKASAIAAVSCADRSASIGRGPVARVRVGSGQPKRERADDFARDLVLDGEDVSEVPVITVPPDVRVRRGVDQLGRDAHPIVDLPHTALDHVAHPELATHLRDAHRAALVDEGRVARDDRQAGDPREAGDQVLGQPIGEVLLLRIGAQVVQRQNRDRGPARKGRNERRHRSVQTEGDAVLGNRW